MIGVRRSMKLGGGEMLRVIGLMSGTSLDGVDAAWLRTDGEQIAEFGPRLTLPYPPNLRRDLRTVLDRAPWLAADDPGLADVVERLTEWHVSAVAALAAPADLIGFHGQTILHRPAEGRSWQVGDAGLLARRTRLPVAWDFRSADVAAGGQGAPLAPVFHQALVGSLPALVAPVAVLNIGGVANLTLVAADGGLLACDTGPGNALLDDWALQHTGVACDRDGALAQAGRVDEAILAGLLADPWFAIPAPKSLDRQDFQHALTDVAGLSPADGAATLAAFTAGAVAATRLPAAPGRWLVTGGGRRNPAVMAALRAALKVPVEAVEAVGWDGDALEAQCFGFLAARVMRDLPLSFPGTTGVPSPCLGGRLMGPDGAML
jgi:anhydro-N-acetylmuramic acid kinase